MTNPHYLGEVVVDSPTSPTLSLCMWYWVLDIDRCITEYHYEKYAQNINSTDTHVSQVLTTLFEW